MHGETVAGMNSTIQLRDVALEPVIELEPSRFARQKHAYPDRSGAEVPDEWERYWSTSLADAGIVGLTPIRPASWHVATREFTDLSILQKVLSDLISGWGGTANLLDPECSPVLNGGFAVISEGDVVLEPMCCCDLGNLADWREAASCRSADWQMLWIGHPWVSVRFDEGLLMISDLHEGAAPVSKYAVRPDDLQKAIGLAEAELEDFSHRLQAAVAPTVGAETAPALARQLAGLS